MIKFLLPKLIIASLPITIFLLVIIIYWLADKQKAGKITPYLPYKLFLTAYKLNPDRWKLGPDSYYPLVRYKDNDGWWKPVKLHLIPYFLVRCFVYSLKRGREKQIQSECYADLLEAIQSDVQKEINKSKEEIETANRMMEDERTGRSSGDTPCQGAL